MAAEVAALSSVDLHSSRSFHAEAIEEVYVLPFLVTLVH